MAPGTVSSLIERYIERLYTLTYVRVHVYLKCINEICDIFIHVHGIRSLAIRFC